MIKFIKKFRSEEEGAVTVDWVVLTAAVVGLGVAGVATVSGRCQQPGYQDRKRCFGSDRKLSLGPVNQTTDQV